MFLHISSQVRDVLSLRLLLFHMSICIYYYIAVVSKVRYVYIKALLSLAFEHENSQVERNLTSILAEFGGNKKGLDGRFDKILRLFKILMCLRN